MPPMGPMPPMLSGPMVMGRVTAAGVPVAGATVVAVDGKTGKQHKGRTDAGGMYQIAGLHAGQYTLRVTRPGYKTEVIEGVTLKASPAFADAQLSAGDPRESETEAWVAKGPAGAPGAAGGPGGPDAEKDAPTASRNFTQAAGTAKGVNGLVNNATSMGVAPSSTFQVGGSNTNNFIVDGVSVSTSFLAVNAPSMPNPDATAMHDMQPWSYSAGPEQYSGINVSTVTKSGSNQLHFSAFESNRNDIFNANEYFRKAQGQHRPVLKQNQFGGSFGGAILHDRAYYFMAYQGTRQSNAIAPGGMAPGVTLYPFVTSQARTYDNVRDSICAVSAQTPMHGGTAVLCNDTSTRHNINPVALYYLNLKKSDGSFVIPGSPNGAIESYTESKAATFQEDQFNINTDFKLSAKHALAERLFYSRSPEINNFTGGPFSLPGFASEQMRKNLYLVLRLTSDFTPNFTNELRVSAQRDHYDQTPQSDNYSDSLNSGSSNALTNSAAGISSLTAGNDQLDVVTVAGVMEIGGNGVWDTNAVNQYQLGDTIYWNKRNHSVKAGFAGELRQSNVHEFGASRGQMNFLSMADFLVGLPGCPTGNCSYTNNGTSYSNINSSTGYEGAAAISADASHSYRYNSLSAFLQDDWKLLPNLTLSLGLRWDYFGAPTDSTGHMGAFSTNYATAYAELPSSGDATWAGFIVPSNYTGTLATGATRLNKKTLFETNPGKLNLAPRAGIAWKPMENSDLMVKAGYGVFYDRLESGALELQTLTEAPYAPTTGGSGSTNYAASLAQPYACTTAGWGCGRTINSTNYESSNLLLRGFDANIATPKTQKWNVEIAKQLPGHVDFTIGYAGAHSIHLQDIDRYINTARLASTQSPIHGLTTNTVENVAMRVPYLGLSPSGLNMEGTLGAAKYNTLQVGAGRRFGFGLDLHANYAWTKTLSNEGINYPVAGLMTMGSGMTMDSNDPNDTRQQYGATGQPQRFSLHYGWMIPAHFAGVEQKLLSGWMIFGGTTMQQGSPLTVSDALGGTIYGGASTSRAQYATGFNAHNAASKGSRTERVKGYFATGAFGSPNTIGNGTDYGNSGTGIVLGPGQNNTDLSISKHTPTHGYDFEFRVEMFNAFNHGQFSNPDLGLRDPVFGTISTTSVNPRLVQFGLKLSR